MTVTTNIITTTNITSFTKLLHNNHKWMYDMLQNTKSDGYWKIVSWMPDGNLFQIYNNIKKEDVIVDNFKWNQFKHYDPIEKLYKIEYRDGNTKEFTTDEVHQQYKLR